MSSPDPGSVTIWINKLKQGDPQAPQKIWESYYGRLMALARKKLQGFPRRIADEEDVALGALESFFEGVREGKFPDLEDRTNLWSLLVVITARKALRLIEEQTRAKRGGGDVRGESVFIRPGRRPQEGAGIEQVTGREPTPEFEARMVEEFERLFQSLGSPDLVDIARWKMDGFTRDEIAAKLGRSRGTVERKLRLIRTIWEQELARAATR